MKKFVSIVLSLCMLIISPITTSAGIEKLLVTRSNIQLFFTLSGYDFANDMFSNAFGSGENKYYGDLNGVCYINDLPDDIKSQIKNSTGFQTLEKDVLNAVIRNGKTTSKTSVVDITGYNDAHFALGNLTITLEAKKIGNDVYQIYVTGHDFYDFAKDDCDYGAFACYAVSYSYDKQEIGELKNFNIDFGFNYTTSHVHDWNRNNSNGFCTICGEECPLQWSAIKSAGRFTFNNTFISSVDRFSAIPSLPFFINLTTNKDAPIRNRPYSSDTTIMTLPKGTKIQVETGAYNAVGNLWYRLIDGTWIYSGNVM
jgi:hypothetical protein